MGLDPCSTSFNVDHKKVVTQTSVAQTSCRPNDRTPMGVIMSEYDTIREFNVD